MFLLLLLLAAAATALRVPGSPFPPPLDGLNASRSLLVAFTDGLSPSDLLTLQLLQGVLNKRRPTLARAPRGGDAELWLNATRDVWGVALNYSLATLPALVAAFAPQLRGFALCALSDNSSNTAAAVAAAVDVLVVTPQNQALAAAAGLPLLYDLRGKGTAWALDTFNGTSGFAFSPTVTSLQRPSAGQACMADYAVASGALQWWDDDVAGALAARVWGSLAPPFAVLGWGPDELGTVTAASRRGGGVVASDWATNLDVLSAFDVPALAQRVPPPPPPPPPPAPSPAQHTVCFLMSDGDNVQFLLNGFATDARWYGSPARGAVPLGWTLSAATADLAPAVPQRLYAAATPRDVFVAGVSGAGYFYPDEVLAGAGGAAALRALAGLSEALMGKAGLRIANVLARADGAPPAGAVEALLSRPGIEALLWYPFSDYSGLRGAISWSSGGKPVIGGRMNLWGDGANPSGPTFFNVTGLARALLAQARDPASAAGYSLVPVHAWSHTVADVAEVMRLVEAGGGGVEAVTPDAFVARIQGSVKH